MNLPYIIAVNALGNLLVPLSPAYLFTQHPFAVMTLHDDGKFDSHVPVHSIKRGIDFMDMTGGPVEVCLLPMPLPTSCTSGGPLIGLILLATAIGSCLDAVRARGGRDLAIEWFRNRLVRWSELIDWKVGMSS